MSPDAHLHGNAEATERLRALVERLDGNDLRRSLGGGWTVAFALAHLAFWDSRQAAALRAHLNDGSFPAEDAVANAALEGLAPLVDPDAAGAAAVRAAEAVDATVAGLTAERRDALLGSEHAYMLSRAGHREEHIEAALAGS